MRHDSINHDIHIHTRLSKCCQDDDMVPANIIPVAEELGLKTVGFADHVWTNEALKPNGFYQGMHENQIVELRRQLQTIETDIQILVGCEADTIAPGEFSITPEFAESLDYVLLACNHLHIRDLVAQPASDVPRDVAEHMLRMFCSGVESGLATSIVHAFAPLGYPGQFEAIIDQISDQQFADAFGLAATNNVAIEITLSYMSGQHKGEPEADHQWSLDVPARILNLAKKAGCKFTLGSDAHNLNYQRKLPLLNQLIEATTISPTDLLVVTNLAH